MYSAEPMYLYVSLPTVKMSPSVMPPIVTVETLTATVKPSVVVVAVIVLPPVIVTLPACAKVTVPFVSVETVPVVSGTSSVIEPVAV